MYYYSTSRGHARLSKSDDAPVKNLGDFKTESEALAACKAHYEKAKSAAVRIGRAVPPAVFL